MKAHDAVFLEETITHQMSGDVIDVWAIIIPVTDAKHVRIKYSHTFKSNVGAGFWYSDSMTLGETIGDAKGIAANWFRQLETAYEMKPWD